MRASLYNITMKDVDILAVAAHTPPKAGVEVSLGSIVDLDLPRKRR